jgi:predicted transcriptional regulator of viral defense system
MTEALENGLNRKTLYGMRDAGLLDRLGRGLYRLTELPHLGAPDLVTVARKIPQGVICLLSALAFHRLVTQIPHEVHVAVRRGAERPRLDYPPIRVFVISDPAFADGVVVHKLDGQKVPIYAPEKAVADAFKFRNTIGADVAMEALRTWASSRRPDVDRLLGHARLCRVEKIIRPYLEALR